MTKNVLDLLKEEGEKVSFLSLLQKEDNIIGSINQSKKHKVLSLSAIQNYSEEIKEKFEEEREIYALEWFKKREEEKLEEVQAEIFRLEQDLLSIHEEMKNYLVKAGII